MRRFMWPTSMPRQTRSKKRWWQRREQALQLQLQQQVRRHLHPHTHTHTQGQLQALRGGEPQEQPQQSHHLLSYGRALVGSNTAGAVGASPRAALLEPRSVAALLGLAFLAPLYMLFIHLLAAAPSAQQQRQQQLQGQGQGQGLGQGPASPRGPTYTASLPSTR